MAANTDTGAAPLSPHHKRESVTEVQAQGNNPTKMHDRDNLFEHIKEAYVGQPIVFTQPAQRRLEDHEQIQDYEPLKLASLRVLGTFKGTVFGNPVLMVEQLLLWLVFIGMALPVYVFFKDDDYTASRDGGVSVKLWLAEQENRMRAFAKIMTGLAVFLLGFYTSTSISRWWVLRTQGVGGIKAATMDLEMVISQFVTQEEKVLSAIRRYSRASLVLVFLWRRGELDCLKDELLGRDELLNEEEIGQLLKWNHTLHETIWAWQTGIVTMLFKEGKIKSPQLMGLLLTRCSEGRSAVQLIHTHLAVRLPMQYVHLLSMLVKMHNFVLAFIMGTLFGAALRNLQIVVCAQLFLRTLILPLLFNAILLINVELSDPFQNSEAGWPITVYEKNLEKDGKAFCDAAVQLPDWIQKRQDSLA
jgi:hypothetical protein